MTGLFSLNLRYILWQQGKPQESWGAEVVAWANCSEDRVWQLLKSEQPRQPEIESISQATGYGQDELVFSDLLQESGLDIWQENVVYLVNSLGHGENGKLAQALGIQGSTISKWKRRSQTPEKTHKLGIQSFFGVPTAIDMEHHPLFLDLSPISAMEQRVWLQKQIEQLDSQTLQQLFPALERLFRDS